MTNDGSPISCPGCRASADTHRLDGLYGRPVAIDVCHACGGLWLDGLEALQLSPGGVLTLLKEMDDPVNGQRHPIAERMTCPRCQARLLHTWDRQRSTRFHYHRCPRGHGRFITFFQFLRSRNFVRELSADELRRLREHVQSVTCSNCGAPVDVARASACTYCQTPISTVEPGQLRAAIEELQRAETERQQPDPLLPMRLLEARTDAARACADPGNRDVLSALLDEGGSGGLVGATLRVLFRRWPV